MENKLKEMREEKNLTQKELSEKSGVARSLICQIETGRRTVTTTDTIKKLAMALSCKVTDIFFTD